MADEMTGEEGRAERRREARVERTPRPRMTDVTSRPAVPQRAVAEAEVVLSQETLSAVIDGRVPKGDVLSVAELAGVMAGKRASELIPLAHPVALTDLVVQAVPDRAAPGLRIRAEAATMAASGVEMEALTAAAIAALTVCDLVGDLQRDVSVRTVRLVSSTSGAGEWRAAGGGERRPPVRAARGAGRVARGSGSGHATGHGPGHASGHAERDGRRSASRGRPK